MKRIVLTLLLLSGLVAACEKKTHDGAAAASGDAALRIFVSVPPQAYFVERVGGERVSVEVLVGPGQSPHTYSPTPSQAAALQTCDAFFSIGMPFEEQLLQKLKSNRPGLNVVDGTTGIEILMLEAAEEGSHDHVHGESCLHGATLGAAAPDPHVWLDPKRVKTMARNIYVELCMLDPEHREEYRANLESFHRDLDELDARIANILAPLAGREFFVFHPAYGYFGDSYGLRQRAVEIEGKEPSPQQVARLAAAARQADVRVIFVQPQFADSSARAIAAEIGGAVAPMDPLARDYLKNLEDMADKLAAALGNRAP